MTCTNFNNESIFKHYFQSCQNCSFRHLPKFCSILNEKHLTPDINHEINPEITPKLIFLGCLVLAYCLVRIEGRNHHLPSYPPLLQHGSHQPITYSPPSTPPKMPLAGFLHDRLVSCASYRLFVFLAICVYDSRRRRNI